MLQKEKVPVIVQADSHAPAGLLVRVIDEAKLGGAEKVSVASARAARG
jgi:biopolymer transport protein ExbD